MKKYNVNIDRQKPSTEEIMAGRDFDGLMKQFTAATSGTVVKKPFWKTGWFIGSAITAVVAISAFVIYNNQTPVNKNSAEQNKSARLPAPVKKDSVAAQNNQPVVAPDPTVNPANLPHKRSILAPLANLNIPNRAYHISSAKGATITHTSGTKLIFPANAFVDANGNPVNGNVDIQYREFRDQVDFFLSGIPMQYDSAGHTYQFESAGMMQITGTMNGQPVFLKNGAKVNIEFASKENSTKYNLYKFDEAAGNWNYLGKDKIVSAPDADTNGRLFDNNLFSHEFLHDIYYPEPVEPVKPVKADKKKNRFTLSINPQEFPEMKEYTDMIFMVDESNQKFDPSWYKVTWESIKLSHGDKQNKYKIALAKGSEVVMLDVYPALDGKAYDEAMEKYQKDYDEYTKKLKEYTASMDAQNQQAIAAKNQGQPITPEQKRNAAKMDNVVRSFTVSGFGIYNMDCCTSLPGDARITLNLQLNDGSQNAGFSEFYLADRHVKSLYFYRYSDPMNGFHFNSKSSNVAWSVKDGELYYADNDQFKTLPVDGSGTLVMKPVGREFKSPEEMKAFFHIGQSN
jgi:hypothetical protein